MTAKIISIGSGKGGVGKTTVSLNIGFALASLGKKTLVVDTDVSLPNLDIYTGLEKPIITLLDVLNGTAGIKNAIYELQIGLNILPCGSSLHALKNINIDKLSDIIMELRNSEYEFVILDLSAGLSKFNILPMTYSDEVFLVVNPDPASLSDVQKVKAVSSLAGINVTGIIVNKDKKTIYEDMEIKLGIPLIGKIPDDDNVVKSRDARKPAILLKPKSSSAKAFLNIARKICGIPEKKGVFERLFR